MPAAFFVGGFVWDAVTLGQSIKTTDLFILLAYLTGAAVILVLIGREVQFKYARYMNALLQFFFGGIFSALFIFYFLSSSDLPGYLVVILLAATLVGNEFLGNTYNELTLSWAFFTLCALMFFNFALAHLFHSISTFWFYIGTLVALMAVLVLRSVSLKERANIWPAVGVAAVMLLLHLVNAIPPVPLVKKEMLVAHDLHRSGDHYLLKVESPGPRFWRSSAKVFHRAGGERVYCFTSVFVPNGITTTIRHRWQTVQNGSWVTTSVVPIRIAGGRKTGYRGFSYKQNLTPGEWRVIAEAESGAAIGVIGFELENGEPGKMREMKL